MKSVPEPSTAVFHPSNTNPTRSNMHSLTVSPATSSELRRLWYVTTRSWPSSEAYATDTAAVASTIAAIAITTAFDTLSITLDWHMPYINRGHGTIVGTDGR